MVDLNATQGSMTAGYDGPYGLNPANPTNGNDGVAQTDTLRASFAQGAGTIGTWWASDLGTAEYVDHMTVYAPNNAAYGWQAGIQVQGSADGSAWTSIPVIETIDTGSYAEGFSPGGDRDRYTYTFVDTEHYRHWRLRWSNTTGGFQFHPYLGFSAWLINEGSAPDPGPPTVLPPWNPPGPAGPIIEIYVRDVNADRWGTATWGEPSIWSGAGWQPITAESVVADIRWGTDQPERGILARSAADVWVVQTYDPDRILDPSNEASPFWPDVTPGTPIRVNHREVTLRTGVIETAEYGDADHFGRIRATNARTTLQAIVPEASSLADNMYERARDAITAAGVAVTVTADGHDPAVAAQREGEYTAWDHIDDAAMQRLYFTWFDRHNAVRFRPWGAPLERGRVVLDSQLVDIRVTTDDAGRFSVVRVRNAADDDTIERAVTPTPRYGRRIHERSDPTYNEEDWAAAVLADRAIPAHLFRPGVIRPLTADDVEYIGTLEGMELVGVTTADRAIEGRLVGGRIRVTWGRQDEPAWRFTLYLASATGSYLVADFTGEPLVDDDDPDEYLTPG